MSLSDGEFSHTEEGPYVSGVPIIPRHLATCSPPCPMDCKCPCHRRQVHTLEIHDARHPAHGDDAA